MSMNTPIGNITQTTPIKNFKELDEMQNEQYLLGIDNNEIGNGSKISLENLINSSISTDNNNLITKGTDDRLLVNTPVEIGDLSSLTTANKSTLVAAINEVDSDIGTEVTNRTNADNNLQSQIDAITASSDVTDIVGTYAELQDYDTTGLPDKSIIKVLQDESRQDETTYYRWIITGGVGTWVLIGEEGPYYTISQADNKFATQTTIGNLSNLATSDKSSVVNAMNELASVLDPTQTADYIKNSKAIYSGEVSENALILPQIKEMSHSTFDLSKFTVVGSPNITNDGIASGFSSSNYLAASVNIDTTKAWEVPIKCNCTYISENNFGNGLLNLLDSSNATRAYLAIRNSKIYLQLYGESAIHSDYITLSSYTLANNVDLTISLGWDKTKYYVKINGIEQWSINSSLPIKTATKFEVGIRTSQRAAYFNGSIDLKRFSITVDGVEVFSGNKTGIDTIKPDDYTVVGTPTISADGVASEFSVGNFVNTGFNTTNLTNAKNWKIKLKCNCSDFSATNNILTIGKVPAEQTKGILRFNTQGKIALSLISNLPNAYADIASISTAISSSTFLTNTDYHFMLEFTGTQYLFSSSLDDITYTQEITITNNNPIVSGYNIIIGLNNTTTASVGATYPFQGSIDLNAFKVYADGNLVYQPCLKIPYTESKTGSKIVNSIYRDRVNDMANQFGYANYYTLSDTNFTLPQVELYGLIRKTSEVKFNSEFKKWYAFTAFEEGESLPKYIAYTDTPKPNIKDYAKCYLTLNYSRNSSIERYSEHTINNVNINGITLSDLSYTFNRDEQFDYIENFDGEWTYDNFLYAPSVSEAYEIGEYEIPLVGIIPSDNYQYECLFYYKISRNDSSGDNTTYKIVSDARIVLEDNIDGRSGSSSDVKSHGGQFTAIVKPTMRSLYLFIQGHALKSSDTYIKLVALRRLGTNRG